MHILYASTAHSCLGHTQILAPSTTGLGGVAVDPPPRQAYPQDSSLPTSQPAWAPKVPSVAAPGPTLGSSIMSSLVGANSSSAALGGTDLLSAASPSAAQADLALGSSYDSRSPVIMPATGQVCYYYTASNPLKVLSHDTKGRSSMS